MNVSRGIADWINGAAERFQMRRFAASASGNVAMLFALACFVIFPMVAFAVEVTRAVSHKTSLQYSTDAAVLAAAQAVLMTPEQRIGVIDSFIKAEEAKIGTPITYQVTESEDGELSVTSEIKMPLIIGRVVSRDDIRIQVRSDAMMGGADLEVSLILDTTGSMAGSRIIALRQAALDFVDIVVNDIQEPYYSKVAIVPYSVSVNAGPFAEGLRGSITPGRSISGAAWIDGPIRNITGATRANPVTITSNGHGFSNGDRIRITGVSGMTQLNNKIYTVANVTTNTFRLQGVNGSSYSNYSSGGQIRRCLNWNCEVTVTANNHGLNTNDFVVINNVSGMTQINNGNHATWQVTRQDANNFMLQGSQGWNYGTYSSGGIAYCTTYGCERYRFINALGNQRVNHASTCITERTGPAAFRDTSPATAPLTIHYDNPAANPCSNVREIVPLTSNKSVLNARINSLFDGGSTSGHLGTAFGWYVLSPNFAHLFPPASRPAPYGRPKMYKVAVLMTDGEFNSSFCNGVISRISLAGSGSAADHINCDSPNGGAFAQGLQLCTAMKSAGITVYTVGFEIADLPAAIELMNQCASSPQHVFTASGSAQLRAAFVQIARSIEEVRLTR
ncbi:ubiquitin-activating E1 FCCH domain-containing protein [Hyphomonas sp.]|uniref:ubiquitin-activating E1 FCCH domain-containing protein n=1 Tax=Hyphomonas sp. TaxID=87 RepID=UPI0039197AF0